MASPDTDELATVPLPAGEPEAEQPRSQAADPPSAPSAPRDAPTVPHERLTPEQPAPTDTAPARPAVPATDDPTEPARQGGPATGDPTAQTRQAGPAASDQAQQARPATGDPTSPARQGGPEASEPARQGGRWWRGLTGSLAAGLTVLAIGVLAVAGICLFTGAPGPGPTLLIGHPIAAALALVAQRVADRRNGPPAVGAGIAVVLFTVSALTMFWLA